MSSPQEPALSRLGLLIRGVEDRLQAEAHCVTTAKDQHASFQARFVESPMVRALIRSSVFAVEIDGLRREGFANGGVGVIDLENGVERRFRFRHAKKDRGGSWDVHSSSDSIVGATPSNHVSLFEEDPDEILVPEDFEQWVVAYTLHPATLTFSEVVVGRVTGRTGNRPPYRLTLEDVTTIPHAAPLPPDFPGGRDDLDLDDDERGEDEDRGEEAG
jgi:hypothetical protein